MKVNQVVFCLALFSAFLPLETDAQILETEESKPLRPGRVEIGAGMEFQTSNEGTETALPIAWEYGLTRRMTLLVEPVCFTGIRPNIGARATGLGDLEITLFYQLMSERSVAPSISVSGEIKIPTAQNKLIGTGKTDFTPYLIASKRMGRFFSSVNLSYTFIGKPHGVAANNLFNYALGTIFSASPKSILFAEVYGNTSALGGSETPEGTASNAATAELAGGETVGAMGYGYYVRRGLLLSFGVSYDNNQAVLFRPGIEWSFGGRR
jgi:hypothetical protein